MTNMQRQRWLEAAIVLGRDPAARVRCPVCDQADLAVTDVVPHAEADKLERYLQCPYCRAQTIMLVEVDAGLKPAANRIVADTSDRETDEDIPPAILERHPELRAVGEALRQRKRGEPITATCYFCGQPLVIDDVVEVGTRVVHCAKGDTWFRLRRTPA